MRYARLLPLLLLLFPIFGGNPGDGSNTCPTSGNKAVSSTRLVAGLVTVQAPSANTGNIYLGGSSLTTSRGIFITPGGSYTYPPQSNTQPYDLSAIRFACTVSADSITYNYVQ